MRFLLQFLVMDRHRIRVRALPRALCLVLLPATLPLGAAGPTVAFNELHYHPASGERGEEFVELYNYGADPVDLSGWVLTGGVELAFGPGDALEPGGYLVLVEDLAAFRQRYPGVADATIAGVYGGALSNSGERLELYSEAGFLVSFLEYDEDDPWPEMADGFGPSLERISPRREDGDAHAWTASVVVGGTPAAVNSAFVPDPEPPGDDVFFIPPEAAWRYFKGTEAPPSDWRATDLDDGDWLEGLAGFGFGDADDNTVLDDMQNGYLTVFIRRPFEVPDPAAYESLRLFVDFDDGFYAYLNGVLVASQNVTDPDFDSPAASGHEAGTPEAFPLAVAALRPGTNVLAVQGHNSSLGSGDFSLHPFLEATPAATGEPPPPPVRPARDVAINEAHAQGAASWVELFNRSSSAVTLAGRRLAPDGDPARAYVFPPGPALAAGAFLVLDANALGFSLDTAASLTLTTSDGRLVDALKIGPPSAALSYGRFPDGWDNDRTMRSPTRGAANIFAPEERVVINEIHYHPGPDSTGGEFIELHNRSGATVDLSGWSFTRGVTFTFAAGTAMAPGSYLVVASDPAAAAAYYGIATPHGPYQGGLRNDAETLLLRDALGNVVDRVRYADEGSWPEDTDGLGPSAELIHPGIENRYGPAWRAGSDGGTPGAANASRESDPEPIVVDVAHAPVIPSPTQPVRVTATVSDTEPLTDVRLFWRRDGGGGTSEVVMADNGAGDDGIAGNGVYGATIPPQPDGVIVWFWIEASSSPGEETIVPAGAPDRAFLYQVEAQLADPVRPIYRVVMKSADLDELETRGVTSNVLLDCTFVAGGRAYYNRGIRYRGASARRCDPLSYRIQFDHDRSFEGIKRLNLNGCNAHRQWIGLDFLTRTGIPTPLYWARRVALNGELVAEMHVRVEAIDAEFLERTLPDDDGGNLYRGSNRADLDYRGEDFGLYDDHYHKETNEEEDDYSDVVDLCYRFDASTTSDEDFPAAIEEVVDTDQWALYFAAYAVLGSTENSIVLNNGDDYFLYHRPSDGRWILLPWDLDSVFDDDDQVLFRPTVPQIERFLEHPFYAPRYWCFLESLRHGNFAGDIVASRIELLRPLFSPSRVAALDGYHPARRTYLDARLTRSLELVEITSGGAYCEEENVIIATQPTLDLAGRAPGCNAVAIEVNGEAAPYEPTTTSWSASVDVSGATTLEITALARSGLPLSRLRYALVASNVPAPLPLDISSDLTLSAAGGPYRLANNTRVAPGATLSIEPGTQLLFDFDATLTVDGELAALGTAELPIVFTSDDCGESWEGLDLRGPSSILRHVVIERFTVAEGFDAAVIIRSGHAATFDAVRFSDGGASTLVRVLSGSTLHAVDSVLAAAETGVAIEDGDATLERSTLSDFTREGVRVVGSGRAELRYSLLARCDTGIRVADGAAAEADHTTFFACEVGVELREELPGEGTGTFTGDSIIIWQVVDAVAGADGANATILFSNLERTAPYPGAGNISADPLFVDGSAGDLRLTFFSPSRGTGSDGTDMGAFPFEPSGEESLFLRCDANADGALDISDAVLALFVLFGERPDARCMEALDCDGDGALHLTDAVYELNFIFLSGAAPPSPFPDCELAPIEACAETTCP